MEHTIYDNELDKEELAACCKKLESYKSLTPKGIKGILQNILEMNFSFEDLKKAKIGSILKAMNQEKSTDPEYIEVKNLVDQIAQKAKKLKSSQNTSKDAESQKPTKNSPKAQETPTISAITLEGMDVLPKLDDPLRNFIVKALVENMLLDYKSDPKGLEANRRFANKAALEIENYLFNKMNKKIQQEYKEEAMSLIAYVKEKTHGELRHSLLSGSNVKIFVDNKHEFISEAAKERKNRLEKALLDANDANYFKKFVPESSIYSCQKCKSKKICTEEKQIRSGDEPMTTIFTCAECGAGWRKG